VIVVEGLRLSVDKGGSWSRSIGRYRYFDAFICWVNVCAVFLFALGSWLVDNFLGDVPRASSGTVLPLGLVELLSAYG
jgi:hypothetical protein